MRKRPVVHRWDGDQLTVKATDCLVCSDIHVPGHSKRWIGELLRYRKQRNIKQIVIVGDFWNFDAISKWELKDNRTSLAQEIEIGKSLLLRLQREAQIFLVTGNHDARMPSALNHAITYREWVHSSISPDVVVTDCDYLYLESGGKKFRLCHPSLYSKIKGSCASALAHDLHENVMMGHQHFLSLTTNKTGQYIAVDLGCMCDPQAFLYKQVLTSRFPDWENGFVHVHNGRIKLITDFTF